KNLNRMAEEQLQDFQNCAGKFLNWPILKGKTKIHDDGAQIVLKLQLGKNLPFSTDEISLIKDREHKEVLKIALELCVRIEDWRTRNPDSFYWFARQQPATAVEGGAAKLGPFSKDNWKDWFDLAWDIILEENDGHPENNPTLRPLGAS